MDWTTPPSTLNAAPFVLSKTMHNLTSYLSALSFLLATPLAGWCQQTTPTSAQPLTLDQAVNIALQNNRSLKNARLNVENGEDEILSIRIPA
jgi:outer membrane protein TolC